MSLRNINPMRMLRNDWALVKKLGMVIGFVIQLAVRLACLAGMWALAWWVFPDFSWNTTLGGFKLRWFIQLPLSAWCVGFGFYLLFADWDKK